MCLPSLAIHHLPALLYRLQRSDYFDSQLPTNFLEFIQLGVALALTFLGSGVSLLQVLQLFTARDLNHETHFF